MTRHTIRKKSAKPRGGGQRGKSTFGWLVIAGTVAVGVAVMAVMVRPQAPEAPGSAVKPARSDLLVAEIRDPRVGEVERRFRCPCGTCAKELTDCECDNASGALEMRAAIVALINGGDDVKATVAAIADRFPGALKSESEAVRSTSPAEKNDDSVFLEVARRVDCPCGNCKLRLIDCDCDHDRGAHEIKAFVRERVRAGRTASEIISAFDRVYGRVSG